MRRSIPNYRAIRRTWKRLDVNLAEGPGAAAEMITLALKGYLGGAVEMKIFGIAGNVGGKIGAIFRLQADFFTAVIDRADAFVQLDHFFDIVPSRSAAAFAKNFHGIFFHQPDGNSPRFANRAQTGR